MVAPCRLMHREGDTFEELPAYDLVIQSDTAIVLDHGTNVFIWMLNLQLMKQGVLQLWQLVEHLAAELTELRFLGPWILAFKEGSSQARYFVSRLISAHKDPPYRQEPTKQDKELVGKSKKIIADQRNASNAIEERNRGRQQDGEGQSAA
ncbi:hypothetical protein V6N11_015891 [Hibiscus sabdariffa]|uniref:Protein transport protein SEC23 n=1 Tax=Hibiscus sabdariffa TaxID=183260 RepID=A0ABR2TTD5_9ROSI